MRQKVTLSINQVAHQLEVEPTRLLIDVLRDDLDLIGTKEGCSIGVCGACSVLADGKLISACLTLAISVSGQNLLTIEGLAHGSELHPLQRAFLTHGGFQCGFCTPGQIMAAYSLLQELPDPNDEEIRDGMLGNLCRCTGYYKIVESIKAAAAEMRGEVQP